MAKKIAIDVRMWQHAGIGRYIRELCPHLLIQNPSFSFSFLGPKSAKSFLPLRAQDEFIVCDSKIYSLAEQFEVLNQAKSADLLHVPHFNIPLMYPKKIVVTVHDLIYWHAPQVSSKSRWARLYLKLCLDRIQRKKCPLITVSEATKLDLLKSFPKFLSKNISVIYESASPVFQKIVDSTYLEKVKNNLNLKLPFILFVGTLKKHKNLPTLISAVENLNHSQDVSYELVVVGRRDPSNPLLQEEFSQKPFIRYLGERTDEELVCLYNLADVFVLPSFHEGFGLPVIEAMACGTPVVASNRTSLPEILQDAGFLFNPDDVSELSNILGNVTKNKSLRASMSEKGLARYEQFSWKRAAIQTLDVYAQALGQ